MDEFLTRRSAQRLSTMPCSCPSADTLAALLDQRLAPAERDALVAHVERCEACTAVSMDFAKMIEAATCPSVLDLLRATAQAESHVAMCAGCAQIMTYARDHQDEAKSLVDLLEAESKARQLGVAVTATTIVMSLLARRAALGAVARGRVHRSRKGTLGNSAARPGQLTWTPFGHQEDTYLVVLTTDNGEIKLRTHDAHVEIDAAVWSKLGIVPGQAYRWGVTALRNGKPVEMQEGWVRFIAEDEASAVLTQEAAARQMPTDRAMLALAWIYRTANLYWEACGVLWAYVQRHPAAPVGHLLLGQVYEEMDRVQEAAKVIGQANRLLAPA